MTAPSVYLVDDDVAVRDSLSLFFKSIEIQVKCFDSAESFLESYDQSWNGCLVLDVKMPGKSGLDLQEELVRRSTNMSVIFITGYGDISTSVRAMKNGAIEFMTKPINMEELHNRVRSALEFRRTQHRTEEKKDALQKFMANLTGREREILSLAIAGMSNKEIAQQLRISYRTVETHRSRILFKAGVKNVLELTCFIIGTDSLL